MRFDHASYIALEMDRNATLNDAGDGAHSEMRPDLSAALCDPLR
jgi:hypothetical protein